ncbi:MAG TPA: enoyl-CoA hydratase-related protein [Methylomirabilota bacterium]|nr:enoyl-CoA hydratase-related protein [Methylomirabilota bacterium]
MTTFEWIRYTADYDVARITLARPPLNILTIPMMEEIAAALALAADHASLKVLVLAGEGRAFCAGVAIEDHVADRVKPMLDAFHDIFRRLRALPCATVAAVGGAALGGGAELATFCDVVVATADATFGQPEIKVGVFPPIAALHYPRRIGAARTVSLLLSGEVLDAAEAHRVGLVDRVVAPGALGDAVEGQVARFRAQSAAVLRLTKRVVMESLEKSFEQALPLLEDIYRYELMTTLDASEGLRAFVEKRKPVWRDR